MKPALLVLAAGMGSRYGGLKQIDPVGPSGEIILDYSIYDALKSGFGKVVFVIRRDIEQAFREHIGAKWENRVQVEYAFQELDNLPAPFGVPEGRVKPWGTGHAILCAKEKIAEPFAAINADDFYGRSGYALLAESFQNNANPAKRHFMVGFTLRNTLSENGSVFLKTDNRILFDYSLTAFRENGFRLERLTYDLHNSEYEKDNFHTEYENNFSEKGFPINRVEAYKV